MAIVSCDSVTLTEEPTAVDDTVTLGGYPDVQAMIDASLDKALALVDAAAARSAEPDPRYATLSRTLRQERDGDWATERMLDPDRPDGVTEAERAAIDALMADNPELDAAFGELAQELADAYAAIPMIEVKVQHLDQNDRPSGKPYAIRSKNGVIDLGFRPLPFRSSCFGYSRRSCVRNAGSSSAPVGCIPRGVAAGRGPPTGSSTTFTPASPMATEPGCGGSCTGPSTRPA